MLNKEIKVAILMAAYNSEETILEAVQSTLECSVDFHLYIVDDASKIPVENIISENENITIIRLNKNSGLPVALNRGLQEILKRDYTYIARMDADDICIKGRFEKQVEYLETHDNIDLVGTWARFFDENTGETKMYYCPPTDPESINKKLRYNSQICHPTWMMRPDILKTVGFYNESYDTAQDYDLLCRIAEKHEVANIPEYLLDYRVSSNGISVKKRNRQLAVRLEVQKNTFNYTNPHCYLGIAKTLILLVIPLPVLGQIKRHFYRKKTQ